MKRWLGILVVTLLVVMAAVCAQNWELLPQVWAQSTSITIGGGGLVIKNGVLSGNGAGFTNLNASALASGTVADALLSSNVPLLNATNIFTAAQTMPSLAGSGTQSPVVGAAAQVGTGATGLSCFSGQVCDSISGTYQFTTGTGSLTAGVIATITPSVGRINNPNCVLNSNSATYLGLYDSNTGNTMHWTVENALAPSTTYTIVYMCGGN